MNSVRLNNLRLKYQSFTAAGCKDIGIRKSEFMAKTQILYREGDVLAHCPGLLIKIRSGN